MPSDQSVTEKRHLKLPCHEVNVVEKRQSVFYVAEKKTRRKSVAGASKQTFLIKATLATTQGQAKGAAAEVRALHRLPEYPNILKRIDSGCSLIGQGIGKHDEDDAEPLEEHRMYCLLFKGSPSRSVRDVMEKHRRKFEQCLRLSIGTTQRFCFRAPNSGWMDIEPVMGIFQQMALAVSVLHVPTEKHVTKESSAQHRIINMHLRPDHFRVYKRNTSIEGCAYIIKLVSAGCAVDVTMSLDSIPDRKIAACLINTNTTLRYRAPEMVNLLLADELSIKQVLENDVASVFLR